MLVGPFVLTELIGSGAMGEVWSAHHATDGVPVAVKVITSARAKSEAARRAFAREVQAMARLHHPNVLMLLDAGEVSVDAAIASEDRLTPQSPYLVMERAHATLDQRAERIADFEVLRGLLLSLLDALAHAHARGVVHRDIKPLNVLVVDEPEGRSRFKLADFGVAHAFRDPHADKGQRRAGASGTPRYMAPEQVVGAIRDQGPWTDLYSLGCVAYWLAAGQTPFSGNLAQVFRSHLEAEVPALSPRFALADG
ncbi:MAG: serine/threonine-protein kinase, partial [Polyangiaceae bacterium]